MLFFIFYFKELAKTVSYLGFWFESGCVINIVKKKWQMPTRL